MLTAIINAAVGALALTAVALWISALAKWDGKVHCDKSKCDNCVYYPDCPHSQEEETE